MPVKLNNFSESTSLSATDFLVGYNNTSAGGERRWSLATLRNWFSSNVNVGATNYRRGTRFIYTADTKAGRAGLTDQWQDVFTNKALEPLRVSFTSPSSPKTALIFGKLYLRFGDNWASNWARIGLFGSNNRTTHPTPTEVISVEGMDGHVGYNQSSVLYFNTTYALQPNTNYTFGMQTYFYKSGSGWVEVNGHHIDGGPRNNVAMTSYTDIYAESRSAAPDSPTQNIGIGSTSTPSRDKVFNNSYINITLL